ncbi:MAG: hypothetical protein K2H49_08720, partial [Muribaculaceae bacterium]|nr:hypothetical protein [Muribaculaceae bacterium]
MQPELDSSEIEISEQTDHGFLGFLESSPHDNLSEILVSRVIPSVILSMRRQGFTEFSGAVLDFWIVDMLLDGLKGSTVKRYVGSLHTLYRKWCAEHDMASEDIDFSISREICDSNQGKRLAEIGDNVRASERLTRISIKQDSPAYVYNRAFQYLLFNPEASFNDILTLKFSDSIPSCPHLEDIVTSLRNAPQAKYVFPLQQGKRRDGAIIKDLISELHATARRAGIKLGDRFSRESITTIWIAAAIKEEIPLSEIRAMIPVVPDDYFFLSMIPASEITDSRKVEIMNTVAYALTNKAPGWFVLRLRNGVTPEKIKERLKEKESPLQRQIQYYYPLRKIK